MSYGGLRGAVGFSLVTILDEHNPFKDIFLTTTLFVIFFTVFIQGSTIKLVVSKLKIQTKSTEVSISQNNGSLNIQYRVSNMSATVSGTLPKG